MLYWIIFTSILLEDVTVYGQGLNRRDWSFITKRPAVTQNPRPVVTTSSRFVPQPRRTSRFNRQQVVQDVITRTGLNRRSWASLKSKNKANPVNRGRPTVIETPIRTSFTQRIIATPQDLTVEPWQPVRPTAQTNFQIASVSGFQNQQNVGQTVRNAARSGRNRAHPERNSAMSARDSTQHNNRIGAHKHLSQEEMMFDTGSTGGNNTGIINDVIRDFNRLSGVTALYAFDSHGSGPSHTSAAQTQNPLRTTTHNLKGKTSTGKYKVLPNGSIIFEPGVTEQSGRHVSENVTASGQRTSSSTRSNTRSQTTASRPSNITPTAKSTLANGVPVIASGIDMHRSTPRKGVKSHIVHVGQMDDIIRKQFGTALDDLISQSLIDDPRRKSKSRAQNKNAKTTKAVNRATTQNVKTTNSTTTTTTTTPRPTTTTKATTTTPKPKPKKIDPWFAGGALPVEMKYRNDNHTCPPSRARWQDYTVYLEVKPRLCLIQITWNARYKQEPIYHNSWWGGQQVEWVYKTVYDPKVEFIDKHNRV